MNSENVILNDYKTLKYQAACAMVVDSLRTICHKCCNTGDLYGTCVKPFEDILSKMDSKICSPDWD